MGPARLTGWFCQSLALLRTYNSTTTSISSVDCAFRFYLDWRNCSISSVSVLNYHTAMLRCWTYVLRNGICCCCTLQLCYDPTAAAAAVNCYAALL